mmetsp:Transcript_39954/g.127793  ORF Transcript_39954/g.127793 Transcript_39954/m.127793 type:complete len:208 (+) Transcript_39954:2373-2996(+)
MRVAGAGLSAVPLRSRFTRLMAPTSAGTMPLTRARVFVAGVVMRTPSSSSPRKYTRATADTATKGRMEGTYSTANDQLTAGSPRMFLRDTTRDADTEKSPRVPRDTSPEGEERRSSGLIPSCLTRVTTSRSTVPHSGKVRAAASFTIAPTPDPVGMSSSSAKPPGSTPAKPEALDPAIPFPAGPRSENWSPVPEAEPAVVLPWEAAE